MGTFAKAIRQIASRSGSRSVKLNGNLYAQAGRILADSRAGVNKSPAGIYTYIAGHEVNEIVDLPVPLTLEDGYQIQIEAEKHLMKEFGWKKCGFKVGATSEAIQNTLGIKTPFYGTIFNDRLYRKDLGVDCMSCGIEIDIIDSPDHSNQWCSFGAFSKSEHNCRGIEAEFGFILKQDILQREADYTWEEVAEYVDEIVPCIEICGSRFEVAVPPGNAPLVIADGAGNSAFLVCNAHEHGPQVHSCTHFTHISYHSRIAISFSKSLVTTYKFHYIAELMFTL
uniref:Uncharacterized protein n=1 Tax=Aplanochytrium stocchinoi TaxID=215587 RepID=A0A7S3LS62_9STRA|mmetsp:Transcript_12102/g.15048  ORF Transcript_12102/g.15048 Transcript_12102/m.15048 type:complete len:282 (-) Transcript_12102:1740-2585(-)